MKLCKNCSNKSICAGQAFTSYKCKKCGKDYLHANTTVPMVCEKCASKYHICQRCEGIIVSDKTNTKIIERIEDDEKLILTLVNNYPSGDPTYMSICFWKKGLDGMSIITGTDKNKIDGPHFFLPKKWIKKLKDEFIVSQI